MLTSQFVDLTHPENLHWLAVLGSSVLLSLASSLVPNYVETELDMRSHNRARLFNETTARLHIAYIIFLLALITSNDIDKTGNTMIALVTLTLLLVFVLIFSIIVSGGTIKRIRKSKDRLGNIHQCNIVDGVCPIPVGGWIGFKVCLTNGIGALVVGLICIALTVNPSLIKHDDSQPPTQSEQRSYSETLRATFKQIARQTKEQFEEKALGIQDAKSRDDKLNASYWYRQNNKLHQLGTTHDATAGDTYEINEESIIGCGFVHKNGSVRWDDKNKRVEIWPYNGARIPQDSCKYKELEIANISSIVCATYNGSADKNPDFTVGICVFTTGKVRSVSSNDYYHDFLKAKAQEFYDSISPSLKNKIMIQQY